MNQTYVCLDLETTGLSPENDHVIEVAICHFNKDGILEEWSSLVKPPIQISEFTTRLTGITNEMVADAPTLDEIREEIIKRVGDHAVMGHFIFFDLNFLNHHGFDLPNTQLDSCQFTQLLLHNEASYSLEVLTKKLGIVQEDAHRALDDVKANIGLFMHLSNHVRALSTEEKSALRNVLEQGTWTWAEVILPLLDEEGGKRIESAGSNKAVQSESHVKLAELAGQTPFLLEEASHTLQDALVYAENLDGSVLLAVPNLELVPQHPNATILKHPNQYLDESRLDSFLKKAELSPTETLFAAKLRLWQQSTQTGDKNEIRIVKEEKQLWYDVCCQETDEAQSYFAKALKTQQKISVIDHYYFLKDRARKQPLLAPSEHLVLFQTENLVRQMEQSWHISLSESRFLNDLRRLKEENPEASEVLDHIAAKISILFGFIGMEIQRYGEPGDTRHLLIVEAHHRNTPQWNKVTSAAASISAALGALGDDIDPSPSRDEFEKYLNYLSLILSTNGPCLWITGSKDGLVIVHSFPEQTARLFHERVWPKDSQLHLLAHTANLSDDFDFIKQELGFPDETEFIQHDETGALPYITPKHAIPSPKDPKNFAAVAQEVGTRLEEQEGNVFLLVTAKHSCEKFFYELPKHMPEAWNLRVQNMAGSQGKLFKMAQQTPGKNVIVGNERLFDFLLAEGLEMSLLAIHRLPFAHPNDPITKARTALHNNAYKSYTLPMAKLRFHGIIGRFLGNQWQGKTVLGLDPRIERDGFI